MHKLLQVILKRNLLILRKPPPPTPQLMWTLLHGFNSLNHVCNFFCVKFLISLYLAHLFFTCSSASLEYPGCQTYNFNLLYIRYRTMYVINMLFIKIFNCLCEGTTISTFKITPFCTINLGL